MVGYTLRNTALSRGPRCGRANPLPSPTSIFINPKQSSPVCVEFQLVNFILYHNLINTSTYDIMADKLETQPPELTIYEISFPAPFVLLVTINREKSMNAIHTDGHFEGDKLFQWFDEEPSLRVAVITGKGKKAFCAGQDLKALMEKQLSGEPSNAAPFPPTGFGGISRRVGRKPVIAAVNGLALGGGFELALNW